MKPTVYIIDEEYHFARGIEDALYFEGYMVQLLLDATSAVEYFSRHIDEIDKANVCLLVDIALSPGENKKIFSLEKTDKYFETGIVLTKYLVQMFPGLCRPENTVLYTAHFKTSLWNQIDLFCRKSGFKSWQKKPDYSKEEFVAMVRKMLPIQDELNR